MPGSTQDKTRRSRAWTALLLVAAMAAAVFATATPAAAIVAEGEFSAEVCANASLAQNAFESRASDAAAALIGGEIDESPFHETVAEAVAQIESYFATCVGEQSTEVGDEIYETCSYYGVIFGTGGDPAFGAVQSLRDFSSPNPSGLEDAFQVLLDFHDETGTSPSNDEVEAANDILIGYYGNLCDGLNVCPLIQDAVLLGPGSAQAAEWARGMEAPAPPGIDAALALIARQVDVSEQDFYTSEEQAADALRNYYGRCFLAITGTESVGLMTVSALVLLLSGATVLTARRKFAVPTRSRSTRTGSRWGRSG